MFGQISDPNKLNVSDFESFLNELELKIAELAVQIASIRLMLITKGLVTEKEIEHSDNVLRQQVDQEVARIKEEFLDEQRERDAKKGNGSGGD